MTTATPSTLPAELTSGLSDTMLEDAISLMMQNAVAVQQSMQIITNTSVTSSCELILEQGKS